MKQYIKSHIMRIAVLLLLIMAVVAGCMSSAPVKSVAATGYAMDDVDVMTDLSGATIDGKPFNASEYPYLLGGTPRIISVNEYCYSMRAAQNRYYALYVYVYNPGAIDLDTDSARNVIQIATQYDSQGAAKDYEKFGLKFCSKSEGSLNKNLWYKFRVLDHDVDGMSMIDRVEASARRYDISGIELLTKGQQNATEYNVGGKYVFRGFAAGCGVDLNDPSTLTCAVEELETVQLDVKRTIYRTDMDDSTRTHHNQLNTVYFALPNELLEKYGYLQKIKAEWWEYKTAPAVVTASSAAYDLLRSYTDIDVGKFDPHVLAGVGYHNKDIQFGAQIQAYDNGWNLLGDGANKVDGYFGDWVLRGDAYESRLPWLFYTSGKPIKNYAVPESDLLDYISTYSQRVGGAKLPIKDGQVSGALFSASVDGGRTRGYNVKEFDAHDRIDLSPSAPDNLSAWESLKAFFGWQSTGETFKDLAPICKVTDADLEAADLSARLLINADDAEDFKRYYTAAKDADKSVMLFRFAVTDYWAADAEVHRYTRRTATTGYTHVVDRHIDHAEGSYVCQETMFFDFDILMLTFNRDGKYKVIAAISNPIDVIGSFEAPPEQSDWWKWILIALCVIIVLIICMPILPYVVKGIVWIVCLPFRGIAWIVKAVKKDKE